MNHGVMSAGDVGRRIEKVDLETPRILAARSLLPPVFFIKLREPSAHQSSILADAERTRLARQQIVLPVNVRV